MLYLLFINSYATNSFFGDDWSVAPLINAVRQGHVPLSLLWSQYNESRLLLGSIVEVLFGRVDRYDLRSVIFFNALLSVASYVGLLALLRRYLGRRLTPIPILLIGAVWFSLADVQNSLWAFQVSWYLTVFFFMITVVALVLRRGRRSLWFVLAVLSVFAASLSTIQGFIVWPIGVICILWGKRRGRRVLVEIAVWLSAMIVTIGLYFHGYNFNSNGCLPSSACSPRVALHHPITAFKFFFALIGNVIPGNFVGPVRSTARFEVVGIALFAAALFILVQSYRRRTAGERPPLPFLLITFSLVFDVTITLGRSGWGPLGAVQGNRYVMPNLILLSGIVIYALAHAEQCRFPITTDPLRIHATSLAFIALAILLVFQVTVATGFGLTNGQATKEIRNQYAQILIDGDHIAPPRYRDCEVYVTIFTAGGTSLPRIREATKDQLGEFQPVSYHHFRELGQPKPLPGCSRFQHPG